MNAWVDLIEKHKNILVNKSAPDIIYYSIIIYGIMIFEVKF